LADSPDQSLRSRKTRDRALILPLVGVMLLLPPFAAVFEVEGRLFGLPVTWVYVFAVWAVLIAGAALIAGRLSEPEGAHDASAAEDKGPE
jgi:hypothetical protein